MQKGATGPDVERLQRALKLRGLYVGYAVDGKYEQHTADAVATFQSRVGLYVDGQAYPEVLRQLRLISSDSNGLFDG